MDKPHRKLKVWHRSIDFVTDVYRLTATFPSHEQFGLVTQMRRSAVSIASNLAEGAARGQKEYVQFLRIAIGSVSELDTQLEISRKLSYLTESQHKELDDKLAEIDRMLIGLRKSLTNPPS